ncbi:YHYH protein [Veronia pacifica]|uniref:YHYH domain-containing protein n=1 Tax=Veronia pacifica TaxID=1080227 RepID=A0A1C3EBJ4_9GAMM|nr:YHYH protein [Veronia pacifica]ODA30612.1 hypothetical protein A8L45_19975 [Veronia pacifica]
MKKEDITEQKFRVTHMIILPIFLFGCGGHAEQTATSGKNNTQSNDITDIKFKNRSGDCKYHIGQYSANVNDIQRDKMFTGRISISVDGDKCVIRSNSIPNHDFNDTSARFVTDTAELSKTYEFAASPKQQASPEPLSLRLSEVVLLNGVKIDLLAAACYGVGQGEQLGNEKIGCFDDQIDNPWRYDPMSSLNRFGTDRHNAHVQPTGEYHYHGNPIALFLQDCAGREASPVIGFAADGFPVFGRCFRDPTDGETKVATSSYQLKTGARKDQAGYTTPVGGVGSVASNTYDGQFRGDWQFIEGSGSLDVCNGMTINGQYGYYVTDSYPWVLGCFKGKPDDSFSMHGGSGGRGHRHPPKKP